MSVTILIPTYFFYNLIPFPLPQHTHFFPSSLPTLSFFKFFGSLLHLWYSGLGMGHFSSTVLGIWQVLSIWNSSPSVWEMYFYYIFENFFPPIFSVLSFWNSYQLDLDLVDRVHNFFFFLFRVFFFLGGGTVSTFFILCFEMLFLTSAWRL